jgi:hypothetical protein
MSTLYVFEWYEKRISDKHRLPTSPGLPQNAAGNRSAGGGHEAGELIDVKPSKILIPWTPPPKQKTAALGQCDGCPTFCCGNQHKYDMGSHAEIVDTVVGLPSIVKPLGGGVKGKIEEGKRFERLQLLRRLLSSFHCRRPACAFLSPS